LVLFATICFPISFQAVSDSSPVAQSFLRFNRKTEVGSAKPFLGFVMQNENVILEGMIWTLFPSVCLSWIAIYMLKDRQYLCWKTIFTSSKINTSSDAFWPCLECQNSRAVVLNFMFSVNIFWMFFNEHKICNYLLDFLNFQPEF